MANMNENQFLKALKNLTNEPLRKLKESSETNQYEYVLKHGFSDDGNHQLFGGANGNEFCPCGSKLKRKDCCQQKIETMIHSLLEATYASALDTTEDPSKTPLNFRFSPVFEVDMELNEGNLPLLKEVIQTHPTIINHLYLISARNIAIARAESKYARYHYNLMVSFEEYTDFDFKASIEGDAPLNEQEKERFIQQITRVPSSRNQMRQEELRLLSPHTFVLV